MTRLFRLPNLSSGVFLAALLAGIALAGRLQPPAGRIAPGVRLAGVNVGGLTEAEALAAVRAHPPFDRQEPVTLQAGGRLWQVPVCRFGVHWSLRRAVSRAYRVGRLDDSQRGRQLVASWELLRARLGRLRVSPAFWIPRRACREVLAPISRELYQAPRNAHRGETRIMPERVGRCLDLEATRRRLEQALGAGPPLHIELVVRRVPPAVTTAALLRHPEALARRVVAIGSELSQGQRCNLLLLSANLNGRILEPGQKLICPPDSGPGTPRFAPTEDDSGRVALWGGTESLGRALRDAALAGGFSVSQEPALGSPLILENDSDHSVLVCTEQTPERITVTLWASRARVPPAPVRSERPERTITLAFAGDVVLDGASPQALRHVSPVLQSADLAFANLEGPLTGRTVPTPTKTPADLAAGREFLFRASPRAAEQLAQAGLDVVSLANNHTLDYGPAGLRDTAAALRSAGVRWCGAGPTAEAAMGPTTVTVGSRTVAFLAFVCDSTLPAAAQDRPAAGGWTIAMLRTEGGRAAPSSLEALRRAVREARRGANLVVVSFHWGVENAVAPNGIQRTLARVARSAGARIVVGHHPHVLQPVEYDGGLVAFSLGNFLFPGAPRPAHRRGALLVVRVSGRSLNAVALPLGETHLSPFLLNGGSAPAKAVAAGLAP